jgi:transcriptional regulator with XRE-family HTH domain
MSEEMVTPGQVAKELDHLLGGSWTLKAVAAALDYAPDTLNQIRYGTNRGMPRGRFEQLQELAGLDPLDVLRDPEALPKRGVRVGPHREAEAKGVIRRLQRRGQTRTVIAQRLGMSRSGLKKILAPNGMTPYNYRRIMQLEQPDSFVESPAGDVPLGLQTHEYMRMVTYRLREGEEIMAVAQQHTVKFLAPAYQDVIELLACIREDVKC